MPDDPSPLHRLATLSGIVPSFEDARGTTRRTSPQTTRALLKAMGLRVADDEEVAQTLAGLERAAWLEALGPVHVISRSRGAMTIPVNVPAGLPRIEWTLRTEHGKERRGAEAVGTLELTARGTVDETDYERRVLVLPELPDGYHQLSIAPGGAQCELIVSPGFCWLPTSLDEGVRLWGVAAQLYLLRSARNWGIGDFTDLERLIELCAALGADIVGVNPLHAEFLDEPEHASPYSPASRLLLNVLNIDVDAAASFAGHPSFARAQVSPRALNRCRAASLVQYETVARLKATVLRQLFERCRSTPEAAHWRAFQEFRRGASAGSHRACIFLALREHFAATSHGGDWHGWPEEFRDPGSAAVSRFADEHPGPIEFQAWLQFLADSQLAKASQAARTMAVGLYRDLAVGADSAGAETWSNPTLVVDCAHVGAPPDIYNPPGQDWGLPPFNPRALRAQAYRSFVDLLHANMRHAGGLRIDHVMSLQQLYWIPAGAAPGEGAYVRYPLEDLIGILALESHRNRCLVVGEDLGTVPEGFRDRMAEARILSYRVLFFERTEEGFLAPGDYPPLSMAVAGSHDLPVLRSWWDESDLRLKDELHLFPSKDDAERARTERKRDRAQLLAALQRAGIVSREPADADELFGAVHTYLARSASVLATVQLDDVTDEKDPVNVPTTSDEHPNWRRRMSATLEEIARSERLARTAQLFRRERAARSASGLGRRSG